MSTIQDIQNELITAYEALTLPHSLGSPTGYKHEPKTGFQVSSTPLVIVGRGVKAGETYLSSETKQIQREYITDVLCYPIDNGNDNFATERNNTADCIEVIENAFSIYGLTTTGVIFHQLTADTGDTEVYMRENNNQFIGVRFRHVVTYLQTSS